MDRFVGLSPRHARAVEVSPGTCTRSLICGASTTAVSPSVVVSAKWLVEPQVQKLLQAIVGEIAVGAPLDDHGTLVVSGNARPQQVELRLVAHLAGDFGLAKGRPAWSSVASAICRRRLPSAAS